ncbi:GNAT family N-acetyltransferase [Streptomyces sp. NPDC059564]|uniref:GNAT family N-acetyltransferase n=1 Tax=Streptomyces sp. NPDC059564 TaxID=3346865 RepID=UPI003689AF3C
MADGSRHRLVPPASRAGGPRDEAELGCRLWQAAWGQGYATEGSRAFFEIAKEQGEQQERRR